MNPGKRQVALALPMLIAAGCTLLAPDDSELRGSSRDAGIDSNPAGPDAADGSSDVTQCTTWRSCAEGNYCNDTRCQPCTDLTSIADLGRVTFEIPEPLTALNDANAVYSLRFPRVFDSGNRLSYSRDFLGGQLWLTEDFTQTAGVPLTGPLDAPGVSENGGLKVDFALSGPLENFNFFFQRSDDSGNQDGGGSTRDDLYAARVDQAGATTKVTRLPAPFNADLPTQRWSFSMALSRARAFWMINNNASLDVRLLTTSLEGALVPAEIQLKRDNGCNVREFDLAPWVTPDGKILLVNATEPGSGTCPVPSSFELATDLYMVRLDASGQPLGPMMSIGSVNQLGTREAEASLSPDLCWMYFASDRDASGRMRLYRARRVR